MVKVLIPCGALGLGYDRAALARGVAEGPDIIAIDGGSTDSGAHYLGTGTSKYSRQSTKMQWRELLEARQAAGVPLVIGTAGTCGADSAVDWLVDITREISREAGMALKIAVLKSGQMPDDVVGAFKAGRITPLDAAPEISDQTIRSCTNIVALAGAEQVQAALATGADVVIAGRTTDTAIIAALPLARGCHAGAAWHGAKVGECGAMATTNYGTGTIMAEFDKAGFTITPMATGVRATPRTVSAHMLYENSDPYVLYEPGGHLDVRGAQYHALDDRRVQVTGSEWHVADRYTVKLEGARRAGFQVVSMVTIRDPHYVANVHAWCADVVEKCTAKARRETNGGFGIELRVIGADATLGALENNERAGTEVGVTGIVTAEIEGLAMEVAKILNPFLLHHPLTENEEMPTFAFPFSPPEMPRGAIHEFCLNHVMELSDPMDAFRLSVIEVS